MVVSVKLHITDGPHGDERNSYAQVSQIGHTPYMLCELCHTTQLARMCGAGLECDAEIRTGPDPAREGACLRVGGLRNREHRGICMVAGAHSGNRECGPPLQCHDA